ncbi:MAG: response regulator [Planctomycetes bacterium]|nr:response regulator [Planctomycetota bacterium]
MTGKPKILCCGPLDDGAAPILESLRDQFDFVEAHDADEAKTLAGTGEFVACISDRPLVHAAKIDGIDCSGQILDDLTDGIVLINQDNIIRWANYRFRQLHEGGAVAGKSFYEVLPEPEITGPDFCPFHTALATGQPSSTRLRVAERLYFQLHVSPLRVDDAENRQLVVVVREITSEVHQQQKLEAIHQAGIKLTDLKPEEVFGMSVEDRIELLKSNILHYTQDVLNFDVVEIRLLEQSTGKLVPLLAEGMDEAAANRLLFARPQGFGVTGFVASTGQSYLCEDTLEDSLYLTGFEGARSSLTVPLVLHDVVIGTFNVESPEPNAFSQDDLVFLEIFARDVALALNTLELLTAQSADTALRSVEAIHRAVARPIDAILNDTVEVLETYIGHSPEIEQKLKNILRGARDVRHLIQEVGKGMAPEEAVPAVLQTTSENRFRNVRVLVVDNDAEILDSAHATLERFGCIVETAKTGGQAVFMVRASMSDAPYDVIITDVRLPDMTGHNLLVHLKQLFGERVPLVLMQGFGYDPGHSIVKARQEGLHPKAVLYKPFRVEQLLDVTETMLDWRKQPSPDSSADNSPDAQ